MVYSQVSQYNLEQIQQHRSAFFGLLWNVSQPLHKRTIIVLDIEIVSIGKVF